MQAFLTYFDLSNRDSSHGNLSFGTIAMSISTAQAPGACGERKSSMIEYLHLYPMSMYGVTLAGKELRAPAHK